MDQEKLTLPPGMTQRGLAQSLGVSEVYISYLINRHQCPSVTLAKRIEAATGGTIRWTDFFPDPSSTVLPPQAR